MVKYELIVIWDDGDKETFVYDSRKQAEDAERNVLMAFGRQITWTGINERR